MSYEMNDLLELVVDQKSSDLHLQVGVPPCLRLRGSMTPIDGPELRPEDTEQLMLSITPDNHIQNVKLNGGTDFGFAYGEKARFRVSVMKAKGNYGLVLRQIPNQLFDLRSLGMPDKIKELLYRPRGLFLVTGPTGSGKSTTLASMVNYINENRDGHIITLGRASIAFFSAEPGANVVGATASLLLECDEAQDVHPDKWEKEFRPMGATTNATSVSCAPTLTLRRLSPSTFNSGGMFVRNSSRRLPKSPPTSVEITWLSIM